MAPIRSVALLVVLAAFLPAVVCEEEAALGDVVGDAGVGMAGYQPPSNVVEHSQIDLDIREIEKAGTDYALAKTVYTEGKHTSRKLQEFSTKYLSGSAQAEPMAKLAHNFWGDWDYSNQHILAALEPLDNAYGDYKTGKWGSTDDARKQIIKKVIKFQTTWLYALHELEGSWAKYTDESKTDEERYGIGGAVHAFDEWWAFYVGSLEDGSQESGEEDGAGLGYGPYIAAEKLAGAMGTGGYVVSNGGTSYVNWELMFQAHAVSRLLQKPGNEEELKSAYKCIRAMFKVPLVQACIRYSFVATTKWDTDEFAKYKGEMWAFCSAALPFVHEVDAEAARTLKAETEMSNLKAPDFNKVKAVFNGVNVNKMGIRCKDIGHLDEDAYEGADHEKCNDVDLVTENEYADAKLCPKTKMPNSGSMLRGSWLLSVSAVLLAFLLR